jgi:hypothetical protein
VFLFGLAPLALAEGPKGDSGKEPAKEQGTFEKYVSAATIDFSSELELAFPGLTTLGSRIETARRLGDPVGLSVAASELAVAEKVSGKKAALTAEALAREAVGLAEVRGKSRELQAVALLSGNPEAQKKLLRLAKKATREEAEDAKAIASGARPRGISSRLIVRNFSGHTYFIFVNGQEVGYVNARGNASFGVHTHGNTLLTAKGGGAQWVMPVSGRMDTYVWTLIR